MTRSYVVDVVDTGGYAIGLYGNYLAKKAAKRNSIVASVVIDITRFEIMGDPPCIKGCKRFFQPYDSNKPSL